MIVKTEADLEGLKKIGKIVANCLQYMAGKVEPGMSTKELDNLGGKYLELHGAKSGPMAVYNFPGYNCISLNHEVAHGVPSDTKKIQKGDLINIDVSAELGGYFADNGGSFVVPPGKKADEELLKVTRLALETAIKAVKAGELISVIGYNIEKVAKAHGYTVIENLGSHGVGRSLHEEPKFIASYYDKDDRRKLKEGHVITIEPFVSTGARFVDEEADNWTLVSGKNHRTAQFEHTMVVLKDRALIVTIPDPV
ncbi:type I methionyl aminopeptidase [Bdellovibrio bacteriovorus]|uniref:type I methionyl aminopeptidase n=1 Tax=Bdellovibrio bacteriovorus TaxID=959 RepID=UPI0021D35E6E|nr:type I methionyl aminopeptidase [Bdellovibrio bacteriovorus]UXR64816.1 type I methionyl aminopeptidase [Bdellovibrio bacteriovorus]